MASSSTAPPQQQHQQPAAAPPPPPRNHSITLTHTLLSSYYTHLSPLAALLPPDTVHLDDSDAFKALLDNTVVATTLEHGIENLQVEHMLGQGWSMREILEQVHTRIFKHHSNTLQKLKQTPGAFISATPKNILAFGYRPAASWRAESVGLSALANYFTNTTVSDLRSSLEWATLLNRIGPSPIITLLASSTTALFTPLQNACYLQISGTPVAELPPRLAIAVPTAKARTRTRGKRKRSSKRKQPATGTQEYDEDVEEDAMEVDPAPNPTPPPPPPPPTISFSPVKRLRTLGPSTSAPQLGSPGRLTLPSATATATALRPTQSGASLIEAGTSKRKSGVAGMLGDTRIVKRKKMVTLWSPNDVIIARHRMYHARPSKKMNGKMAYGLSPLHILSRLPVLFPRVPDDATNVKQQAAAVRHLTKYVFPRQFGLHNAFCSPKTFSNMDILPDYEDRELEIKRLGPVKTPERLKGDVSSLLELMVKLHERCNYRKLLDRHCPKKFIDASKEPPELTSSSGSTILGLDSQPRTQMSKGDVSLDLADLDLSHPSLANVPIAPQGGKAAAAKVKAKPKFTEFVCSVHEVKQFVHAVVREVIPRSFWGSKANQELILDYVASFLRLRRFENLSIHTLLQGFCLTDCSWLIPRSASKRANFHQKPNEVEMSKRKEVVTEFLYWFFDGFVINLVKTAFNITDSATHQNRALFFRQDDWHAICRPMLKQLSHSIFQRVPENELYDILRDRSLGFSYVRLLPKATGVRPIINLARRPLVVGPTGKKEVGKTINKILRTTFDVLTFEKKRKPSIVGALVSNPQEIYAHLKEFKQRLRDPDTAELPKLYFVKVDVQSCYDTINQDKLLEIVDELLTENDYWVQRYTQVTPAASSTNTAKTARKFQRKACGDGDLGQFSRLAEQLSNDLHNAVIADQVVYLSANRAEVLRLLKEHIKTNLVKIGSQLYSQKNGIPQGSVLSSLLCSLFYGDMEKHKLKFTQDEKSLLLRYVDDFMFITTKKPLASKFLTVMDRGHPEYGCFISTEKRLTNFDIALRPEEVVPPLGPGKEFPWCGLAIDTKTLDVKANTSSLIDAEMANKLTVQRHRKPGQSFLNAMLRALKVRAHMIYNDTSHNSQHVVYLNIYQSILVVALKFQAYVREWGVDPRKRGAFFLGVISSLISYQLTLLRLRPLSFRARAVGAQCIVDKSTVVYLAQHAFIRVLGSKPTVWKGVLDALRAQVKGSQRRVVREKMARVVGHAGNTFVEEVLRRK